MIPSTHPSAMEMARTRIVEQIRIDIRLARSNASDAYTRDCKDMGDRCTKEADELESALQALSATSEPVLNTRGDLGLLRRCLEVTKKFHAKDIGDHAGATILFQDLKQRVAEFEVAASPSAGGEAACQHKGARFFNGKLSTTNSKDLFIAWCEDCGAARTTLAEDWLLPKRHLGRGK